VARALGAVGLLGGGVIGGGWAARFLLAGIDVKLYDPDPEAGRKLREMRENARRALVRLSAAPLPREGALTIVATPAEAAEGVQLVQESAPERLELKQSLLAEACAAAAPDVLIASSTSGLRPTALAGQMAHPGRFLVAHPFNPVYLLPLVELCAGERTEPETIARAEALYRSLGMAPLVVRKEIDGFVADRMLEALWREALWLVNDGVATVAEVDDAIRLAAGLRWSFMGTFLTYRIAGGEDGMRHFMAQFGPALKWPWTKLMDVPELTGELLDTIVQQSDEQAGALSVRELEQLRDDCLVSVLQALRGRDIGAGAVLARHERALSAAARPRVIADDDDLAQPLALHTAQVAPDWVDYNGHAHESRYLQVFGDASDALFAYLGIDADYLASGSYFTVESHLSHLREALLDDRLAVATQVLDWDARRLHVFHSLTREGDGELLATAEQLFLHVDTAARRAAPASAVVLARARRIADAHAALPRPDRAGRSIGIPRG
jgi:carnitine 3-dehydrogenase